MNVGWRTAKLVDLGVLQTGTTPSTRDKDNYGNFIPFVKPAHFNRDGTINLNEKGLSEVGLNQARLIEKDSVLMVCIGATIGKTGYITTPVSCNQQINTFTPNQDLSTKYFYYLLSSDFFFNKVIKKSSQATIPIINKTKWGSLEVPYPTTLEEQKQIVAILDQAFTAIDQAQANIQQNIQNAQDLFQSKLNQIFSQKGDGWQQKKLSDICNIKHGFAFKSAFFRSEGDFVVLTPGSFYEKGGFRDQGEKTKFYEGEFSKDYLLNKGDFLFAMTEQAKGLLGSSLIVQKDNYYLHNQRLGLVEVLDEVIWCNDFFFHQFNTKYFRDAVQETASGVKVRHTSPKKLGAINIFFPQDLKEQQIIANLLNNLLRKTEEIVYQYELKIKELTELKKSLLQKAFSGELTQDKQAA